MQIKEIHGDLLKFPEGITTIVHQANVRNTMGAGIAYQIKKEIPEMWQADCEFSIPCGKQRLGEFSFATFYRGNRQLIGFNLYGQDLTPSPKTGFPTDYDSVRLALAKIKAGLMLLPSQIIGFPVGMGSVLGGADWNTYKKIITDTFEDTDHTLVFVEFSE